MKDKLTNTEFNEISLNHAINNINDTRYSYLNTEQTNDFDLFNYINIEINKNNPDINEIKITPSLDKHPEYNEIIFAVVAWNNGKSVANRKKPKNKNSFVFLINKNINIVSLFIMINANNNPELLDIELKIDLQLYE